MFRNYFYIALFSFLLAAPSLVAQFYNGTAQDFSVGKPQYKTHEWRNFEAERFRVHFYGYNESETLAEQLVHATDSSLKRLEVYFDTKLDNPVDVILFTSYEDYLYSNVGEKVTNDNNIGGEAPVERFRAVIYSTGNYKEMVTRLNEQLAQVILNNIFFGGNWRDALRNTALLDMPDWYKEGLKSYLAQEWNSELDNHARIGILSGNYKKLNRLKGNEAKYAGHALWKFIADVYGENVIPNIIYLTRVSSNIEPGFAYVLGSNINKLHQDFFNYYTKRYSNESFVKNEIKYEALDVKLPKRSDVLQFALSSDKHYALMVVKKHGKCFVELLNLQKKSDKKVFSVGRKYISIENDFAPVVVWHPNSEAYTIFYKRKEEVIMRLEDVKGDSEKNILPDIEKVVSASYSPDGKQMVISGIYNGQSDIFVYTTLGNAVVNITADAHSDLNPSFLDDGETIVFSSNRNTTFSYDVFKISKTGENIEAITNTPKVNELNPLAYGKHVSFIADNNGVFNRYFAFKDSMIEAVDTIVHYRYFTVVTPISNLPFGIKDYQQLNNEEFFVSMKTINKGRFFIAKKSEDKSLTQEELLNSAHLNLLRNAENIKKIGDKKETKKTDDKNITYEKEIVTINESESKPKQATKQIKKKEELDYSSAQFYERDMMISQVVSQLDNGFMNPIYQYYNPRGYYNPGLNTTIKVRVQDVFDDYAYEGGVRFPFNFDSNEVFFKAENKKKPTNKGVNIYRTTIKDVILKDAQDLYSKTHIYEFTSWLARPLSFVSEIKLDAGLRHQSQATLGQIQGDLLFPDITLEIPTALDYKAVIRASYVFNNSYSPSTNTRFGTRIKLFGELYNDVKNLNQRTIIVGIDARHHQKLVKDIVWANRLSFAASMEQDKMLFYIGGVENWLFPKYDKNVAHPENFNLVYQTIGIPMRGFVQNARNGSNFAVFNSELRLPLFRTLSATPIKSEFLYHFQIIGFADAGTAWTGFNPYDNTNSFNVKIVEEKNILIKIQNNQEPMVYGYGFGIRSKLFGYHVRLDWAWGIDDGIVTQARYLSLALDF